MTPFWVPDVWYALAFEQVKGSRLVGLIGRPGDCTKWGGFPFITIHMVGVHYRKVR